MALLQLAENGYNHLAESAPAISKYIFIPAGMFDQVEDTYVREDFFDSLSDAEYKEVITALAPYQNVGMSAVGLAVTAGLKAIGPIVQKAVTKRAERVASGESKPIFKDGSKFANLKDKVAGAIGKLKDQTTKAADQEKKIPVDISGNVAGTTFDITSGQPAAVPFFTKYKTPILVVGGLGAAFLLYKVFTKK
jgi:hypothetical protein